MKNRCKSFVSLVLAAVMVATCVFAGGNAVAAGYTRPTGDLNGDFKVNAVDALLVLRHSVGKIDRFPIDDPVSDPGTPPLVTHTDTSPSDVIGDDGLIVDPPPEGYYRDFEDFYDDAVKEDTKINRNLVYIPIIPTGFSLITVEAYRDYTSYGFSYYTDGLPPKETTVIGMDFAFYDGNKSFYGTEPFSATEQAKKAAQNKFNKYVTVFTLPDGREVLMYAVCRDVFHGLDMKLSYIHLATTINGKFVFITASISSEEMANATNEIQWKAWNACFSEFMEQKAQSEFTRLLNEFRFEEYNFAANRYLPIDDLNGDYEVNAADALLILQFSVGKIDRFPIQDLSPVTDTDTPPSEDSI